MSNCYTYNHMLQINNMMVCIIRAACCLVHGTNDMLWTDGSTRRKLFYLSIYYYLYNIINVA